MSHAGKAPTVAEEMAKFNGFTTNNGETVPADKTTKGASSTLSDDERRAGAKLASGAAKSAAAKETKLSDDESAAAVEAATAAAIEAGDLEEGEELSEEAHAAALAGALKEKTKPSKSDSPEDRLKRAQAGRRKEAAARARAERETVSLRDRVAALEAGGAKPLTKETKDGKDTAVDKEPDPKDFEFGEVDAKYIRALARYEAKQEIAEASKNQQTQQQTAQERKAAKDAAERRSVFEDKGHELFDDFQEVVLDTVGLPESDPDAWPLSATLVNLLLDSPEQGPKVMYALAGDPKEARRIAKMSPRDQERWFYKEEMKLEAEAEKAEAGDEQDEGGTGGTREAKAAERRESKAPKVISRTKGGSHQQPVSSATTDFRAFEAKANAESIPRR